MTFGSRYKPVSGQPARLSPIGAVLVQVYLLQGTTGSLLAAPPFMRETATVYAWITRLTATIYAWITRVIHSSLWTTCARVRRIYAFSFGLLADVSQRWFDD